MRRGLAVANWKMHGDTAFLGAFAQDFLRAFRCALADARRNHANAAEVVICPPWGYLSQARELFRNTDARLGVQDVATAASGAFTGEQAAPMGRDLGATYAIVGHSERRRLFAETDAVVAAKFRAAQDAGLTPILCVGETLAQRRSGDAIAAVLKQVDEVAAQVGLSAFANAVIAYEPVWAIGSGETATPPQAQAMHLAIRSHLARSQPALASAMRLLYGGSVTAANAAALFAEPDIDGGLIGGASLDAEAFARICCAAAPSGAPP